MKCHVVFAIVSLLGLSLLAACGGGSSPATTAIAYVAHSQSHSLSVIKIPADKTEASIEIGNSSSFSLTSTASYPTGVAVTPDGSLAYVTDAVQSVWVVDTASNSVIAKIAAGSDPESIAITPDGKSAYVTSITCGQLLCSGPGNPPPLASVEVIDTASNSLTATITIGNLPTAQTPGALLSALAISPDGTRVYVSNVEGNQIWAIDTSKNQVVATIATAELGFFGLAISPDGSHVYAASVGNPSVVDVIDAKTNVVVTSIALPGDVPTQIRMSGNHAFVTGESGKVWVIDTTLNATMATISVTSGQPLLDIALAPDGSRAYISCGNTNAIYALDTTTYRIVGQISSPYPGGLAIARPR